MLTSSRIVLIGLALFEFARFGVAAPADTSPMPMKSEILAAYVKITAALAADDLKAAKTAATEVAGHADMAKNTDIAEKAKALAAARNIHDARGSLIALTAAVEPLATGDTTYKIMHCPMVNADWIQTSDKVQNPYYGKSMFRCGAPKKTGGGA